MALLDPDRRTIVVRVLYWGPARAGKRTNLRVLHGRYPADRRGELVTLMAEGGAGSFDYFPAYLGRVAERVVRVDIFTAPDAGSDAATRAELLRTADGVAFVADSARDRAEANGEALEALVEGSSADLHRVFQWNRRDGNHRIPVESLEDTLNPTRLPSFTAIAVTGQGVWETHLALVTPLLHGLREMEGRLRALGAQGEGPRAFAIEAASAATLRRRGPSTGRRRTPTDRDAGGLAGRDAAPETAADAAATPTRRTRRAVARRGVMAAAVGGPEGELLAALGPMDAAPMVAAAATASGFIRAALAATHLGLLVRWGVAHGAVAWYVRPVPEGHLIAAGPTEPGLAVNLAALLHDPSQGGLRSALDPGAGGRPLADDAPALGRQLDPGAGGRPLSEEGIRAPERAGPGAHDAEPGLDGGGRAGSSSRGEEAARPGGVPGAGVRLGRSQARDASSGGGALASLTVLPGVLAAARFDWEGRCVEVVEGPERDQAALTTSARALDAAVRSMAAASDAVPAALDDLHIDAAGGWLARRRGAADVIVWAGVHALDPGLREIAMNTALTRLADGSTPPRPVSPPPGGGASVVPVARLAALTDILRDYLGPAARPVLRDALAALHTEPERLDPALFRYLVEHLAAQVGNAPWREAFRQRALTLATDAAP